MALFYRDHVCGWGWLTGGFSATRKRYQAALTPPLVFILWLQGLIYSHFLLCVPFIPRVIPVSSLQTFSSKCNHLNVLDVHPLDYRCVCKMWVVILTATFLLFTGWFPEANRYADISPILEKCLLLTAFWQLSHFFASFCMKTPPKRCLYSLMPLFPFSLNPLNQTLAFTTPSKLPNKGITGPLMLTWIVNFWSSPSWPLTGAWIRSLALLFDFLSSLGYPPYPGFPLMPRLLLSFLSCFLLFFPTTQQ